MFRDHAVRGRGERDRQCRNVSGLPRSGINFFDTAYVYTDGKSEQYLGRLIASERDQIILVTKAGAVGGLSAQTIRTQLEVSLKRLNQDYTDIFFLHRFDEDTPLEETFEELLRLKEEGKFFHLGVPISRPGR